MNPEIFCCQPFKNEWKLVVFLLFSSCFAAIFKLFALFFSNFDKFQKFFRIFSENFQIFFRNFWKICESRDFLLPAIQKWMKTGCFSAVFKLFCCYFQTFCVVFLEFWQISKIFQNFFRKFSDFFQKFLKIFWNISEKIMNAEIFCCQRFKNEGKLAVLLLFSNFLRCFSRILTNFRNFSENFQNFFRFFSEFFQKFLKKFWNISEKFMHPEIFCCQPFKNEWKLAVLLLFSKFSASFSYFWQFPGTKSGGKLAVLLLFSNFFVAFLEFWRISEIFQKFLKNLWIQRFSAANHSKMKETSCFAAVFKVFS